MMTLLVIVIVWWVAVRIVDLLGQLWRLADAAGSPGIGVVTAAQG
jgi:hypothetical protein